MAHSSFNLSRLNGTNGFVINSAGSVSNAGDINNDGIDDLIIGRHDASPNGITAAGQCYVIFGGVGVGSSGNFNVSSLNGTNGFVINGTVPFGLLGYSVSNAGDINNDGIDDLMIGAMQYNYDFNSVQGYVVFGGVGVGSGGNLNISTLNGTNGLTINGTIADVEFSGGITLGGISMSNAGDINGDGIDDLIIGTPTDNPNGIYGAGQSFVVFGGMSGSALNLSELNGTNGFAINGAGYFLGHSVSSAGDINGDGFDDLIIGVPGASPNGNFYAGQSYVVFGSAGVGSSGSLNVSTLNGTNGFVINGVAEFGLSGHSVSSAGDINGDGFDDLIIGAPRTSVYDPSSPGQSYVVFGGAEVGISGSFNLSSLDGTNGFVINGISASDNLGTSVSSAGDINGDGFDDLILVASGVGQSYVVFGGIDVGSSGSLNISDLNGTNGFIIDSIAGSNKEVRSASSAGDINGDRIDDLILTASFSNQSYVLFGNSAPTVDLNGAASGINYTANFSSVPVTVIDAANLTVADTNTPTLAQVTITITNLQDGVAEILSATTTGTKITASYNASNGTLTLKGTDTLANYQQVLRTITYNNNAPFPHTSPRTIEFVLDDGQTHSNTSRVATTNLTITPLNLRGTPNPDILIGTPNNNIIDPLGGNDTLTGGGGQDQFVIRLGGGIDTITDFGGVGKEKKPPAEVIAEVDTLKFQGAGLIARNLLLTQTGSNLEITFECVADSPKVILQNFALENLQTLTGASINLGNILFDGETSITDSFDVFDADSTSSRIFNKNTVTFLNDLNNRVKGFDNSNDVINAQGGHDWIDGKSGNDLLRGGAGNDTLIGGVGDDILIGGAGNDILTGAKGRDQFVYQEFNERNSRGDIITDFNRTEDKLVLTDLLNSLGYSGSNPISDRYLLFVQLDTSTLVQIDSNGGADNFKTLATLNNFTATNLVIGTNVLV